MLWTIVIFLGLAVVYVALDRWRQHGRGRRR